MRHHLAAVLAASTLLAAPAPSQTADQATVLAVVKGFHDALAKGDSLAAMAYLAADVRILETGGVETREEYRSGHLSGDIAFARAVPSVRAEPVVTISGDVAWVTSTSRTTGSYRDRQINSAGAELMVLSRTPEGWRIRAIHWSSRAIRNP
jgi:ketosteroid isomerase-like protein